MRKIIALPQTIKLYHWVCLMRPKQWLKNGFICLPLIFSGKLGQWNALADISLTVLFFCVAASILYIINDLCDLTHDANHPVKRLIRPLASGSVSLAEVFLISMALLIVLSLGFFIAPLAMPAISLYIVLGLAYSFFLKRQPVIDIFCIAFFFVLRVWAGAEVLRVSISGWMLVTTFSLALYLASVKRYQEMKQETYCRDVLQQYTLSLIDRYTQMASIMAALFYSLFVVTVNQNLIITIPLVLFGLYRYGYLTECLGEGESPTDVLLRDRQLLSAVSLWFVLCIWIFWPR